MPHIPSLAAAATVLCATALPGFAEPAVEMRDDNARFTTQIGGDINWDIEVDLTGQQSTAVAVSPEGHEPLIVLSVMTFLQVNPAALADAESLRKTTEGFLEGLCRGYQCADMSNRRYETLGDRRAWVLPTTLDLSIYANAGIPDALLIATATPTGYMQLFSLHTAEGQAGNLAPVLLQAFEDTKFDGQ